MGGDTSILPTLPTIERKESPTKKGATKPSKRAASDKPTGQSWSPTEALPKRQRRLAQVREDRLGEFVLRHTKWFQEIPWRDFVRKVRGAGDLRVCDDVIKSHPAGELLRKFERNGVPVALASPPWDQRTKDERSKRGSHRSCDDHLEFLRGEILEFVEKGFWILLPYRLLKHLHHLRLSPMGVVPQRGRRPRLIVDYSFYGLNQETLRLTPAEAMQFGRALERILYYIRYSNPRFGNVYLGKVDLADGFYRLGLSDSSIMKLAVAFPKYPGEEQLVAAPLSIPMGWVESPPAFCTATETVADLANNMDPRIEWPVHPLEQLAWTPPEESEDVDVTKRTVNVLRDIPPVLRPLRKPVAFNDIYVDDFIQLFQGAPIKRRKHLRRLLYAIDMVFRPLEPTDRPSRQHVPSIKKLLKGDAYPSVTKVVLGWLINTAAGTIELPAHRQERLQEIFRYLHRRKRVPERKWHKILGELRSMIIGIPGSRGLFSMLQLALQKVDAEGNITLDGPAQDQIKDFQHLAADLSTRPTAIAELVPDHPVAIGPHDASGSGMGGVWIPATTNSNLQPILWRARFPPEIINELVSFDNPMGKINNSELELAGQIGHQDVLIQEVNCAYRTVTPLGDNTTAVAWSHKGSVTTSGPSAYLLRLHSLHQRHYRYLSKPDYIPGIYNRMADDLSRTTLAHCPPEVRDAFFTDLGAADEARRSSVVPKTASAKDGHWAQWSKYCQTLGIDPYLETISDKLPFLEVFGIRLRSGDLTPSGKPVASRTVEDYLRSVGEEIACLGSNPRLDAAGNVVPSIQQLQRSWTKEDPPPERVKPIPLQLVRHVVNRMNFDDPFEAAKADALIIGFFYMLRPGEHTWDRKNNHPFRFCDVSFSQDAAASMNAVTISDAAMDAATRVFLNFTTQKNGEKDEAITHGSTIDPLLNPVAAVRRRVQHLRLHHAPPATPLYTVFLPSGAHKNILSSHLTSELRLSCAELGDSLGIYPREISARALRAGGAMALILAKIDPTLVKLMGRWKSDIMLRYLHRSALHTADFAAAMLQHGVFIIPRHQALPAAAQDLLDSVAFTPLAA